MSERITIIYPDGSRGKVTQEQQKQMLRDGVVEPIDRRRFRYVGHAFRFRNLADLRLFRTVLTNSRRLRNYPGIFIWEHQGKRFKELLEPPDKLALRLNLGGNHVHYT